MACTAPREWCLQMPRRAARREPLWSGLCSSRARTRRGAEAEQRAASPTCSRVRCVRFSCVAKRKPLRVRACGAVCLCAGRAVYIAPRNKDIPSLYEISTLNTSNAANLHAPIQPSAHTRTLSFSLNRLPLPLPTCSRSPKHTSHWKYESSNLATSGYLSDSFESCHTQRYEK